MSARRTKRTDGRYTVTLTVENLDGTRRRVYFYGRTQADARRKADAARERVAQSGPVRDATRSVSDWLCEWRGTFLQASDRASSTKSLYAGLTLRHVEPVIGRSPLGQVRPSDITHVLLTMERGGSAASTRRNAYAALRSAFDDAVADGLLALNPVLRVRRPKASSAEALSLTVDEVKAFLAGADGLRYAGVLRLILGTGLRRGEALALRWCDVNFGRGEASVKGSLVRSDGKLIVADTKSLRSRRTVSLSPAIMQFLTNHRALQLAERRTAANLWTDTGLVFATELGRPVDPRNLLRATTIASRKAGLPPVGVHTLRHTYATTALLRGVPIHVVSRNLGHSSIAITADIYGHLTDEAARDAALTVSDALNL
jgi:integrase